MSEITKLSSAGILPVELLQTRASSGNAAELARRLNANGKEGPGEGGQLAVASQIPGGESPRIAAEHEKALSGFEAMLLNEMFKSMFASVSSAGLFGEESNESKIYQDMFTQAVAEEGSKNAGIGVKKVVREELARKFNEKI